jgi:uncharacterized protein YecE (DUF72 family)
MSRARTIRIGISGWTYGRWRGTFYPPRLQQSDELFYASREFDTIEINGTFYGLQRPDSFARWYDETPEDFVFAVKGSRFITHLMRLRDVETALANFFASGVLRLEEKLGPFLWQFPPSFGFDAELLDRFLTALPRNSDAAAALAERHDRRIEGRAWTKAKHKQELRHAVEIRHQSFMDPNFVALLRLRQVALVFADSVSWPYAEDVTTDFVYLRLHGSEELYASGYSDEALDRWAARITLWARGLEPNDAQLVASDKTRARDGARDVYVYFDNDAKVRAPVDARSLRGRLPPTLTLPRLRGVHGRGPALLHFRAGCASLASH